MKGEETRDSKQVLVLQLGGNMFWLFIEFLIIIACIIIVIFFCIRGPGQCTENTRVLSSTCDDCNSCSNDYLVGDTYCRNDPKLDGEPCDSSQLCFNSTLCTPTCSQGQCSGGPLSCCIGFCETTDDCPDLNVTVQGIGKLCQTDFNSCYYRILNTNTDDCLSLILPAELRNCLEARFVITLDNNGECDYVFKCAPQYYGTAQPLDIDAFGSQNLTFYYNFNA